MKLCRGIVRTNYFILSNDEKKLYYKRKFPVGYFSTIENLTEHIKSGGLTAYNQQPINQNYVEYDVLCQFESFDEFFENFPEYQI